MSAENVEVVRASFEAWNAGDMDAHRETYHPDVIVRAPEGWPEPGPFVGREEIMRQFKQMRDTWDADALELISDFLDAGDRVAIRFIWHGAGYGPEANLELTTVYTVRDGRIFYQEFFWDHAEALEAMGLSERERSQENVEIVRRWLAAMTTGPEEARAAVAEFCDPGVDYYPVRKFPEARPCHGQGEFSQFLTQYADAFPRTEWAIQDLIDVGAGRVLVCVNMRAEGRGSGIKLEGDIYQCYWLRHRRFFRIEDHLTMSGALRALGLEGETLEAAGARE